MSINDWDDAFENMGHIPNSKELPDFWSKRAALYRTDGLNEKRRIDIDMPYGTHAPRKFLI